MARSEQELAALGARWEKRQRAYDDMRAELKRVVLEEVAAGTPEAHVARLLKLNRMTVRSWLGKRQP